MSAKAVPEQVSCLRSLLKADLRGLEDRTSLLPVGPSPSPHTHSGHYHQHKFSSLLFVFPKSSNPIMFTTFFSRSLPIAVVQHGGIAFLLMYLVCLTVVGAPLLLLETTLGGNQLDFSILIISLQRPVLCPRPSTIVPPPVPNPRGPWSCRQPPSRTQGHP